MAHSAQVPKHGIVSLLDSEASARVRRIWNWLETEFGLRGVLVMPHPHFSYQIAEGYDRNSLEATLHSLSAEIAPFIIQTTGLGQFEGGWPVVFIGVNRSAALVSLHERIWNACRPHSREPIAYYQPGDWVPHITLAHGEEHNSRPLTGETVVRIRDALRTEDLRWELRIDNLALVWDDGVLQEPVATFPLRGR